MQSFLFNKARFRILHS